MSIRYDYRNGDRWWGDHVHHKLPDEPISYTGWHEWARERGRKHKQVKCPTPGCGRFCDWTYAIHRAATTMGMHLHDEVIHNAGPGPRGHNIKQAKRARRSHSKLLVFTWRSIR